MQTGKKLPDTPWHVGFTKKEDDDPRRHKARCIFILGGLCKNGHCGCFQLKCRGSAHCQYYAESMESWHEVWRNTRSIAQEMSDNQVENSDRARKVQDNRIREAARRLGENRLQYLHRAFSETRFCPVCSTKLVGEKPVKICPYCQGVFVKEGSRFSDDPSAFVLRTAEKSAKYKGKTIVLNDGGKRLVLRQDVVPVGREAPHETQIEEKNISKLSAAMIQALNQVKLEDAGLSPDTLRALRKERLQGLGSVSKLAETGQLNRIKNLKRKGLIEILDRIQAKTNISFHDMYLGDTKGQ